MSFLAGLVLGFAVALVCVAVSAWVLIRAFVGRGVAHR